MNGGFEPAVFFREPRVILRLICLLFAIIVLAAIEASYYTDDRSGTRVDVCLIGSGTGTGNCTWTILVSVLAILTAIAYLLIEYVIDRVTAAHARRLIYLIDLASSAIFVIITFLTFCITVSAWGSTLPVTFVYDRNPPQAALTFLFFGTFSWALLTVKVYQNYISASSVAFAPTRDAGLDTAPYMGSGAPASFGDTYQDFTQPPLYNGGSGAQQQQQRVPY